MAAAQMRAPGYDRRAPLDFLSPAWTTGRLIDLGGRYQNDVYLSIAQAIGMKVTSVGQASWCKGPAIV